MCKSLEAELQRALFEGQNVANKQLLLSLHEPALGYEKILSVSHMLYTPALQYFNACAVVGQRGFVRRSRRDGSPELAI